MYDLSNLHPEIKAYALVGAYLQHWAFMEAELNRTIAKALDLDGIQNAILCTNLKLRDKINVVKTATNLEFGEGSPDAKKYIKMLNCIASRSVERNMIAHDIFSANEAQTGVSWITIKAKEKLAFPDNDWSQVKFQEKYQELKAWASELKLLQSGITRKKLVRALLSASPPTLELGLLGSRGLPSHLLPAGNTSGSPLSIIETNPQTPPETEAKSE